MAWGKLRKKEWKRRLWAKLVEHCKVCGKPSCMVSCWEADVVVFHIEGKRYAIHRGCIEEACRRFNVEPPTTDRIVGAFVGGKPSG